MKSNSEPFESEVIQRLTELCDIAGPHFVHELIELFFKMGRKDFDLMKYAVAHSSQKSSIDKFRHGARSLKATSFNLGANALGLACEEAEALSLVESKSKLADSVHKIESHLIMTEDYLREYVQESQSSAS